MSQVLTSLCSVNPLLLPACFLICRTGQSVDWQMMFNTDKCKSLHFGNKNVKSVYLLGDKSIRADEEEKHLGVIIYQSLKSTNQYVTAAKSSNKTLGKISRTFVNKDTRIMLKLYQSLVRP